MCTSMLGTTKDGYDRINGKQEKVTPRDLKLCLSVKFDKIRARHGVVRGL